MQFKEWLKKEEYINSAWGEVGGFKAVGPSKEDNGVFRKKGIRDKYVADGMKKLKKT
jgi:hypothetical protein